MNASKGLSQSYWQLLIIAFSCGFNPLLASVDVTSNTDNGLGGAGTLSAAINTVNMTPSSSPILIESSASPLSWTANMPSITTSLSIESDTTGSSRTIIGNEHLLQINSGTTTLSSDLIWNKCNLNVYGASLNVDGVLGNETNLNISENGIVSLSGNNSSSLGTYSLLEGTLQLLSNNSTGTNSTIQLFEGTLDTSAPGTVNVGQVMLMTNPGQNGIFTASSGSTLLIDTMQINLMTEPSVPNSSPGITINGPGTVGIGSFDFSVKCSFTITGLLGGDLGLNLRTYNSSTPVTLNLSGSGANTYTGNTAIGNYCTLQLPDGGSLGTLSSTVTVGSSSATDATFSIGGAVSASTYTNYGSTSLNGSVTVSNIFINYGTLSGCGTITGNFNSSGGTYPGCSPSSLTINGNAELFSGSILSPYLNPNGIASFDVSGNLTIDPGASLIFRPDVGCYLNGFQHDFLSVGGTLTGTFSSVDSGSILLIPQITYGLHGATLALQMASLGNVVKGTNAKQVGYALDLLLQQEKALGDDSYCDLFGDLIPLSITQISSILDQLHPALFKGFTVVQENNIVKVRDALSTRIMNEIVWCGCEHYCHLGVISAWGSAIGDFLYQSSNQYAGSPQVGYHNNMEGFVLGVDYHFSHALYAGLLGAYTNSNIHWNNFRGKGNIYSGYGGAYFSAAYDRWYVNTSIIGAGNQYKGDRTINYPSEFYSARSRHGGYQLLSHLDAGLNFQYLGINVMPFDSLDYINQQENSFNESSADLLDLSVRKNYSCMYRNELGVNFTGCLFYAGITWKISPKISWVQEMRVKGAQSVASFVGTDETFSVKGFFPTRALASPGIDISGSTSDDYLMLTFYYNGEFDGNYNDHSFGGQINFKF